MPVDTMAYPHRDVEFAMSIQVQWGKGCCMHHLGACLHEAMTSHATGGVYANFVPERIGDQ